jgi:hypothetical protein
LQTINCLKCNTPVFCTKNNECWCYNYPQILSLEETSCMCEACFHKVIIFKVAELEDGIDPATALNNNPYKELHKSEQLVEDVDYFLENGFFVFKKWHHLKRGYCCKSGCRHCPYGFKKE